MMRSETESLSALLSPKMDPSLWSKLPRDHLQDIFDALPVKDHYLLRMVCKHWLNRASERRRVPTHDAVRVREPFFLLFQKSWLEGSPCGTLALQAASGQWLWRKSDLRQWLYDMHEIGHLWESFEVEGVLFQGEYMFKSVNDRGMLPFRDHPDVLYDVHRDHDKYLQKHQRFPTVYLLLLEYVNAAPGSVLGMMVDDASRVYTLILGSCVADTLVLDSRTNKWESKPSRLVRARPPSTSAAPKSCVQLQGKMYLWMDCDEIHVYSPSLDQWSTLAAPPSRDAWVEDKCRGLGHWAGALYAVRTNNQGTLSVWKLNKADEQWSEYAQIPGCLFAYLIQPSFVLPIVVSHCNGYLLMHVVVLPKRRPRYGEVRNRSWPPMPLCGRFVLFNIASRRWEMVNI